MYKELCIGFVPTVARYSRNCSDSKSSTPTEASVVEHKYLKQDFSIQNKKGILHQPINGNCHSI